MRLSFLPMNYIGLGLGWLKPLSTIFQCRSCFFGGEDGVTGENHRPICTYNKTYKPSITDDDLCLNVSYAFFCPIDTTQMSMISDNLWN
jgi:hypothetical protein